MSTKLSARLREALVRWAIENTTALDAVKKAAATKLGHARKAVIKGLNDRAPANEMKVLRKHNATRFAEGIHIVQTKKSETYVSLEKPVEHPGRSSNYAVYDLGGRVAKAAQVAEAAAKQVKESEAALRADLWAVVNAVTTLEMLVVAAPIFEGFPSVKNGTQVMVINSETRERVKSLRKKAEASK